MTFVLDVKLIISYREKLVLKIQKYPPLLESPWPDVVKDVNFETKELLHTHFCKEEMAKTITIFVYSYKNCPDQMRQIQTQTLVMNIT